MKQWLFLILMVPALALAVKTGSPAPDFSSTDSKGIRRSLNEFKGKHVVLEWHNQGCPFVKKHYGSGNMQALQKEVTGKDVVWLTVLSSAPGKQGHMTGAEAEKYFSDAKAAPSAVLLDPDGKVGGLYDARTTPHMFIIDPKGTLVYQGAIDDNSSPDPETIKGSTNYVRAALAELKAGKKVSKDTTEPYGCSVKYK